MGSRVREIEWEAEEEIRKGKGERDMIGKRQTERHRGKILE